MTFTVYFNLSILAKQFRLLLLAKCLRQYLVFESGPAEIPMCELGLSVSLPSLPHPIPSTSPSMFTFTAEVVLVSCPKWFKYRHKMHSGSNYVMLMDGLCTLLRSAWAVCIRQAKKKDCHHFL